MIFYGGLDSPQIPDYHRVMTESVWDNKCRCDDVPMNGSDHCPECGCEEFEEVCN